MAKKCHFGGLILNSLLTTVEMVGKGHPDSFADAVSEAVLDYCLSKDKVSRVAIETLVKNDLVVLAGELTTKAKFDKGVATKIVKKVMKNVGYTYEPRVQLEISVQSPDIAQGVNENSGLDLDQGAGDNGFYFGYSTNATTNKMPLCYNMNRAFMMEMDKYTGKKGILADGKCQICYDSTNNKIVNIVMNKQTTNDDYLKETVKKILDTPLDIGLKKKVALSSLFDDNTKVYVNACGKFELGGPFADAGVTGRKLQISNFGGVSKIGGGALAGKDLTKCDKSLPIVARIIANKIVDAGLADEIEIRLATIIGISDLTESSISYYKGNCREKAEEFLRKELDGVKVKSAISMIPKIKSFSELSQYGYFGKNPEF